MLCACLSIPGFNGSEDCAALELLLEGYDQQDQDQVSEVCNSPLFKYMDNDVSGPLRFAFFHLKRFSLWSCKVSASIPVFSHQTLLIKEATNSIGLPHIQIPERLLASWLCCAYANEPHSSPPHLLPSGFAFI